MQARITASRNGARWLLEGWRLFAAAPFGWLVALFLYWLGMTLLSALPFVGAAAAAVLVPAFSVGFMALARAASRRAGGVAPALLFDGFRHEPRAQLALGFAYLGCLVLLLGASALADEGALARWLITGKRPDDEVLQSDGFLAALAIAATLYLPVMAAFWFAPPLAAWHGTGAAKALFFSAAAWFMNWRAFLAYGAVTATLMLLLPLAVFLVLALVSGGGAALPVAALVFPLLLVMLPTLFASFYASYRDVFGYDPPA